jgi:hypothetical protein
MAKENAQKPKLVKISHLLRPDWDVFMIEPTEKQLADNTKPFPLPAPCQKACTASITLVPQTKINPHTGIGFSPVNVDGFRWLNAYITSDSLHSTSQRGFTLELFFSLNPFVGGVGVRSQASTFFNMESFYDGVAGPHQTQYTSLSDLTRNGGTPYLGGVDLTQVLRVPVIGP